MKSISNWRAQALWMALVPLSTWACRSPASANVAAPTSGVAQVWDYTIDYELGMLEVDIRLPPGVGPSLSLSQGGGAFVRELEVDGAPMTLTDDAVRVLACETKGCRVHYRFDALSAGRVNSVDFALTLEKASVLQPRVFLLHPTVGRYSDVVHFRTGPRVRIPLPVKNGTTECLAIDHFERIPYAVVGDVEAISDGEATLLFPESLIARRSELESWFRSSLRATRHYSGRDPVTPIFVSVQAVSGKELYFGFTRATLGGSIVIRMGRDVPAEELQTDWVLPHELLHLSFPTLPQEYRWVEEGFATYAEVVSKLNMGLVSEAETAAVMVRNLKRGRPESTSDGLNVARSWERMYWGGAGVFLEYEARIHEAGFQGGVQAIVRRWVDEGISDTDQWSFEEFVAALDRATGTMVARDIFAKHHSRGDTDGVDAAIRYGDLAAVASGKRLHSRLWSAETSTKPTH